MTEVLRHKKRCQSEDENQPIQTGCVAGTGTGFGATAGAGVVSQGLAGTTGAAGAATSRMGLKAA
ncbi:hypothetical protein [Deinococcus hopiensis]|uniref:Uncharacterized protein n=1 Tax=Deinococcus hopiensis KR-140 TaxID=695939 RepID=A0A1W1UV74_9DEIO|nr:hypothetical protein [Deinococcus hopiensis]SMB84614.1 hypothetical protein SAMN00790413_05215 [Deinococcus hopiensis KR-140]